MFSHHKKEDDDGSMVVVGDDALLSEALHIICGDDMDKDDIQSRHPLVQQRFQEIVDRIQGCGLVSTHQLSQLTLEILGPKDIQIPRPADLLRGPLEEDEGEGTSTRVWVDRQGSVSSDDDSTDDPGTALVDVANELAWMIRSPLSRPLYTLAFHKPYRQISWLTSNRTVDELKGAWESVRQAWGVAKVRVETGRMTDLRRVAVSGYMRQQNGLERKEFASGMWPLCPRAWFDNAAGRQGWQREPLPKSTLTLDDDTFAFAPRRVYTRDDWGDRVGCITRWLWPDIDTKRLEAPEKCTKKTGDRQVDPDELLCSLHALDTELMKQQATMTVAVVGPSRSGKTTLIDALTCGNLKKTDETNDCSRAVYGQVKIYACENCDRIRIEEPSKWPGLCGGSAPTSDCAVKGSKFGLNRHYSVIEALGPVECGLPDARSISICGLADVVLYCYNLQDYSRVDERLDEFENVLTVFEQIGVKNLVIVHTMVDVHDRKENLAIYNESLRILKGSMFEKSHTIPMSNVPWLKSPGYVSEGISTLHSILLDTIPAPLRAPRAPPKLHVIGVHLLSEESKRDILRREEKQKPQEHFSVKRGEPLCYREAHQLRNEKLVKKKTKVRPSFLAVKYHAEHLIAGGRFDGDTPVSYSIRGQRVEHFKEDLGYKQQRKENRKTVATIPPVGVPEDFDSEEYSDDWDVMTEKEKLEEVDNRIILVLLAGGCLMLGDRLMLTPGEIVAIVRNTPVTLNVGIEVVEIRSAGQRMRVAYPGSLLTVRVRSPIPGFYRKVLREELPRHKAADETFIKALRDIINPDGTTAIQEDKTSARTRAERLYFFAPVIEQYKKRVTAEYDSHFSYQPVNTDDTTGLCVLARDYKTLRYNGAVMAHLNGGHQVSTMMAVTVAFNLIAGHKEIREDTLYLMTAGHYLLPLQFIAIDYVPNEEGVNNQLTAGVFKAKLVSFDDVTRSLPIVKGVKVHLFLHRKGGSGRYDPAGFGYVISGLSMEQCLRAPIKRHVVRDRDGLLQPELVGESDHGNNQWLHELIKNSKLNYEKFQLLKSEMRIGYMGAPTSGA